MADIVRVDLINPMQKAGPQEKLQLKNSKGNFWTYLHIVDTS
jgi:hypothetical protein